MKTFKKKNFKSEEKIVNIKDKDFYYLLGFIFADGNISRNKYRRNVENKIRIMMINLKKGESEKKILSEFQNILQGGSIVERDKAFRFTYYSIDFCSLLSNYGICPNKTYEFSGFKNLEKKYLCDLMRGIIDGDGSLCENRNTFRITCHKPAVEPIIKILNDIEGDNTLNFHLHERPNDNYCITVKSSSAKRLLPKIYNGGISLSRKNLIAQKRIKKIYYTDNNPK